MGSNKVWYEFLEHLADGLTGLFLGPESDGLQTVFSSRKLDTRCTIYSGALPLRIRYPGHSRVPQPALFTARELGEASVEFDGLLLTKQTLFEEIPGQTLHGPEGYGRLLVISDYQALRYRSSRSAQKMKLSMQAYLDRSISMEHLR